MQDRWDSGAPASALSGPEDSSMIRALADLLAYLFPISACKADLLRTGLIRRS